MRAVHPGEVLREEYLAPLSLSVNALAMALGVPVTRIPKYRHFVEHQVWASLIEVPVGIDKKMKQPLVAGDEAVYWLN
jgi:hypothetical protein